MGRGRVNTLLDRLPWKTSLAFVVFSLCIAMFTSTSGGDARDSLFLRSVPGGGFEECSDASSEAYVVWVSSDYGRGPVFSLYRVRFQGLQIYDTSRWDYSTGLTAEVVRPVAARIFDARFPGRVLPELAQKRYVEQSRLLWYGVVLNALFALALLVLILKLAALLVRIFTRRSTDAPPPPAA